MIIERTKNEIKELSSGLSDSLSLTFFCFSIASLNSSFICAFITSFISFFVLSIIIRLGILSSLQNCVHSYTKPLILHSTSAYSTCLLVLLICLAIVFLTCCSFLSAILHFMGARPISQLMIALVVLSDILRTLHMNSSWTLCRSLMCLSFIPIHDSQLFRSAGITWASNRLNGTFAQFNESISGLLQVSMISFTTLFEFCILSFIVSVMLCSHPLLWI